MKIDKEPRQATRGASAKGSVVSAAAANASVVSDTAIDAESELHSGAEDGDDDRNIGHALCARPRRISYENTECVISEHLHDRVSRLL